MSDNPNDNNSYIFTYQTQKEGIFKYKFPWIICLIIGIICLIVLRLYRNFIDINLLVPIIVLFLIFTYLGSQGIIINLVMIDLKNHSNVGIRNPAFKWSLIFFDNIIIFLSSVYLGFILPYSDIIFLLFLATSWLILPLFIGMAYAWVHRPFKYGQYQKYLRSKKNGFNPVVAIVLMVAITVIMFNLLYIPSPTPYESPPYMQRKPENIPDIDESWINITEDFYVNDPIFWNGEKIIIYNNVSIFVQNELIVNNSIIVFDGVYRFTIPHGSITVNDGGKLFINNSRITSNEIRNKWKGINLRKNCSIKNTIIEYMSRGIYINSINITIENNTFKSCSDNINCGNNCTDVVIKNNRFLSGWGIDVYKCTKYPIIKGNLFKNNCRGIILMWNTNITDTGIIENNSFINCKNGIWLTNSKIPTLKNCYFKNNSVAIEISRISAGKEKIITCEFVNNTVCFLLNPVQYISIENSTFKNNMNGINCNDVSLLYIYNCTFLNTQEYDFSVNSFSCVKIMSTNFDQIKYIYRDRNSEIYVNGNLLESNYQSKINQEQKFNTLLGLGTFLIILIIVIFGNIFYCYKYYKNKKFFK